MPEKNLKRTYRAPEIHCQSCAALIAETMEDAPDVRNVEVNVAAKTITIEYGDGTGESNALALLKSEGYSAHPR